MAAGNQHTVYIIAGPTGVGKTAIAIEVAQKLGTSIISADSRQCYKDMTIGTAKPDAAELRQVKHYFVDAFPLTQQLTAADFEQLALGYLQEIFATHDTAVVCGGTGLYIKALCGGLDAMPAVGEAAANEVERQYREQGISWLQQEVQQFDPEFFARADTQNPARLIRALSFFRATGERISDYRTQQLKERPFRIVKTALELPRPQLYARIDMRVDGMMEAGLLKEAEHMYPHKELKNLQTVGYVELFGYLEGNYSLDEAVDKIKQHSRNYAKRQMTWFRKDPEFTWFRADDPDVAEKIIAVGKW